MGAVGTTSTSNASQSGAECAAPVVETRLRVEEVGRGVAARARDDAAHRRVERVGVRVEERADSRVPLGHVRALVEHRRDGAPRREVDLAGHAAQRGEARRRRVERLRRARVAEELELVAARDREGERAAAGAARSSSARAGASGDSRLAAAANTRAASATVSAKIDTQSSERQAGTTPRVDSRPRVGFQPTMLLKPAGTRPEPAVSVPSAKWTSPAATATAEPELEPPEM